MPPPGGRGVPGRGGEGGACVWVRGAGLPPLRPPPPPSPPSPPLSSLPRDDPSLPSLDSDPSSSSASSPRTASPNRSGARTSRRRGRDMGGACACVRVCVRVCVRACGGGAPAGRSKKKKQEGVSRRRPISHHSPPGRNPAALPLSASSPPFSSSTRAGPLRSSHEGESGRRPRADRPGAGAAFFWLGAAQAVAPPAIAPPFCRAAPSAHPLYRPRCPAVQRAGWAATGEGSPAERE